MMRRKLVVDRTPDGRWVVREVATGDAVTRAFVTKAEAERVWAELRDVDHAVLRCA